MDLSILDALAVSGQGTKEQLALKQQAALNAQARARALANVGVTQAPEQNAEVNRMLSRESPMKAQQDPRNNYQTAEHRQIGSDGSALGDVDEALELYDMYKGR